MTAADSVRTLIEGATPSELPALAGELARGLADVLARTTAPVVPQAHASPHRDADTLLTVSEAAERLGVARSWLYRHAKTLPFTRKLGYRTLRFDARALERWTGTRVTATERKA